MPLKRLFTLALVAAALPAAGAPRRPPPAAGAATFDPRQEKMARTHFDRAEKAFNVGRFDEALAEYQAAYQALPLPAFVFNLAQCHRNLGNEERAIFFYQRYLTLQPDAANRPVVEELIAEQQRHIDTRKAAEAAAAQAAAAQAAAAQAADDAAAAHPAPDAAIRSPLTAGAEQPARRRRISPKVWIFGVLGAAVLGGVTLLFLRSGGTAPTGLLGAIDAR